VVQEKGRPKKKETTEGQNPKRCEEWEGGEKPKPRGIKRFEKNGKEGEKKKKLGGSVNLTLLKRHDNCANYEGSIKKKEEKQGTQTRGRVHGDLPERELRKAKSPHQKGKEEGERDKGEGFWGKDFQNPFPVGVC